MDIDTLISEIFVRSPLWDQKNTNHHNRFVLDKLWDEVASKLNTTRTMVRNKWKSLRDKFRTTLASIPKPKSGDAQINDYKGEWKYFKSLLFLKDQFTPRKSEGNLPKYDNENFSAESSQMSQDESDRDDISERAIEDESMQSPPEHFEDLHLAPSTVTASSSQDSTPSIRNRKKRLPKDDIGEALLQVEQKKLRILKEKNANKNEEDADLDFFKSLLPHVRTLSPYDKLEYRMRVMKLTQEFINPNGHCPNENASNNNCGSASSGQQNTARNFYNDAERLFHLSGSSELLNPLHLLN